MPWAFILALVNAGSNMAARIAMMAMTTSSSIRVNADVSPFWVHGGVCARKQPRVDMRGVWQKIVDPASLSASVIVTQGHADTASRRKRSAAVIGACVLQVAQICNLLYRTAS